MCAGVRVAKIDVFKQCHFFKDIFGLISLVQTAVDNGEGQFWSVLEQYHRGWHPVQLVDFTGDL